jgi:hypothetical protein
VNRKQAYAEWRTGLHAANPEQAKALVADVDRLRHALEVELIHANAELHYLENDAPPGRLSGTALSDARARVKRLEEALGV